MSFLVFMLFFPLVLAFIFLRLTVIKGKSILAEPVAAADKTVPLLSYFLLSHSWSLPDL